MKQLNTNRINIIGLASEGLCSFSQAAISLGISQRQIQRLAKVFKHGNNNPLLLSPKPRNYWNKKSDKIRDLVISLKKESLYRSNYAIADLVKEGNKERWENGKWGQKK